MRFKRVDMFSFHSCTSRSGNGKQDCCVVGPQLWTMSKGDLVVKSEHFIVDERNNLALPLIADSPTQPSIPLVHLVVYTALLTGRMGTKKNNNIPVPSRSTSLMVSEYFQPTYTYIKPKKCQIIIQRKPLSKPFNFDFFNL